MRPREACALILGLAALLSAGPARAFCRTSSCNGMTGAVCTPAEASDCGTPLFWATSCVGYSIQKDASKQISFTETERVLAEAFATWTGAACRDGGHAGIAAVELAPAECAKVEYNTDRGNTNLIVFRDSAWPYEASQIALTTVSFDPETGQIKDADMELNSAGYALTTVDVGEKFDLLSVVTHEAGHFLGLAHSNVKEATMYFAYGGGNLDPRTLEDDDRDGICAVAANTGSWCEPQPRHGFSTSCGDEQTASTADAVSSASGCGCGTAATGPARLPGVALAAVVLAALGRRRRANGGRTRRSASPPDRSPRR